MFNHIAITGLGLIGGSLARDIRELGLASTITGFGRNPVRLKKACTMGLIDAWQTDFAPGIAQADLIIIGTPVRLIPQQAFDMLPHIKQGAVITDVGSVKTAIVEKIEPKMPPGVFFIGGHPIAGTENSGFEAAIKGLFKNRACVLTPTDKTDPNALKQLTEFWAAVGAHVVQMDIKTHDMIFAGISHLPHMVAFSLVNAVTDMENFEKQILQYSAGGFRDFTRIAASDPAMWRDIALMNKDHILNAIDFFEKSLGALKQSIAAGDASRIEQFFKKSHDTRRAI
jgi:prephenate dehydrogenase